jgi:transcriptional antiterminator RfaH
VVSSHDPRWYAFVTRPRHEKKVKAYLDGAGMTSYLPLRKTLNQWKDRKKWIESPVFPSYIFCHIPYSHRFSVLEYPSVVRIVGFNQQPTPVQEKEIDALKMLLASELNFDVRPGLIKGDFVRIKSGLLMGYEGQVTQERGETLFVLHITSLGKSIILDASQVKLEKI